MQRSSWSPFATVDHQLVGGSSLFRGQRHGGEKEQEKSSVGGDLAPNFPGTEDTEHVVDANPASDLI